MSPVAYKAGDNKTKKAMNKELISRLAEKVEASLGEVQRKYFKQERNVPERLNHLGFDNITGNASLYDFFYFVETGDIPQAKRGIGEVIKYIDTCIKAVEAYKPTWAICTWRGFDADVWVPLRDAKELLQEISLNIK